MCQTPELELGGIASGAFLGSERVTRWEQMQLFQHQALL